MKPWLPRILLSVAAAAVTPAFAAESLDSLQKAMIAPPAEARPMVRWWWFGPSVVKPQLEREMNLMKTGGFGGFEVQPTYPLALDGQYPDLKNFKFLSPQFYDMLGFTAAKAKEIGLRMDLTIGSGWPFGGPMITREEAVQSIRDSGEVTVAAGQTSAAAPEASGRGSVANAPVIAALLGPITDAAPGATPYLPLVVKDRIAQLPTNLHGATQVRFFSYASAGLMQVKRAAFGAEGFIVDHYSPTAIEKFIKEVAQPEIAACGPNAPYSIFCDSLEISAEGWTPNFPAEFRKRRGYDLIPLLPALFDKNFPHAEEIRGDYGRTVAELFNDAFTSRFAKLAKDDHTRFRIQAYGTPPTTIETYARADIAEGESHNWRSLSGTRWAASANHVLGRPVTSSEAFTWLHSPVFMAAPIDIKAESNLQFLNGVNQLLYHGWPYTAPGVEYPGWRFYAAAVFNEKNPWWLVMPDINRYLSATSYLLRQGSPANDVAIYLPEEDAFGEMTPSNLQMVAAGGGGILNRLVNGVIPPILDAGFNFDGIDAGVLASRGKVDGASLAFGDVKYRVVVLPNLSHITLASLRTLAAFAQQGGTLIAVGQTPSAAPGYLASAADHQAVHDLAASLFTAPGAKGIVVTTEQLSAALTRALQPDVVFAQPQTNLGFIHRRLAGAEMYFLANTSNAALSTTAEFRVKGLKAEWWDATTGRVTTAKIAASNNSSKVAIDLPPFGAQFLVFSSQTTKSAAGGSLGSTDSIPAVDLSADWNVTFANAAPEPNPAAAHFATLLSWTEQPATHNFSGVATYQKSVEISAAMLKSGSHQQLDFGLGEAVAAERGQGIHANFQPPIGDSAVVYINDHRAGALWCPPYTVDVTGLLHTGTNQIRIEVANRAVNFMADTAHHPLPDYRALNASPDFGGNRFQAQDMNQIKVAPSGLLGKIQLRTLASEK
jgi:hypothetical protein